MKECKSLLNKLTVEKFDIILQKLFSLGINDELILQVTLTLPLSLPGCPASSGFDGRASSP